jgi:hypothetical protein
MSSTPQSVPLKRRSQGRLAIAVGVLVAIAVAVALIAGTGRSNPNPRPSAQTAQAGVRPRPAAALGGTTASSPTVQPNPDHQGIRSQLEITSQLEQQRGRNLPGWLLR